MTTLVAGIVVLYVEHSRLQDYRIHLLMFFPFFLFLLSSLPFLSFQKANSGVITISCKARTKLMLLSHPREENRISNKILSLDVPNDLYFLENQKWNILCTRASHTVFISVPLGPPVLLRGCKYQSSEDLN